MSFDLSSVNSKDAYIAARDAAIAQRNSAEYIAEQEAKMAELYNTRKNQLVRILERRLNDTSTSMITETLDEKPIVMDVSFLTESDLAELITQIESKNLYCVCTQSNTILKVYETMQS